jgi:ABC-type transport system substrate-binding protein
MALSYACPVPLGFPVDPAGVTLMVGSGPYYVSRYEPGQQIILRRNPQYRGPRPRGRLNELLITFGGTIRNDMKAVESGHADLLAGEIPFARRRAMVARFGLNRRQLFRITGVSPYPLIFNTSRPLFRDNVALRKAVNFALDRTQIANHRADAGLGLQPTDQILPTSMPDWTDQQLYPMRADLGRARALAQGHLRGGKAVLYVFDVPDLVDQAQVIVADLRKIGLQVTIKKFGLAALDARAGTPGEPYDMLLSRYDIDYPDPANVIVRFLASVNASRPSGNTNFAYFKNTTYDRRMATANALFGAARMRAFAALDAELMRNEAPWAPLFEGTHWMLVSAHVGCMSSARSGFWTWCIRGG